MTTAPGFTGVPLPPATVLITVKLGAVTVKHSVPVCWATSL